MSLKIEALSGATEKGKLNTEWLVLHNEGDKPYNLAGCSIAVGRSGNKPHRVVTTLKAGLVVQPGERCRVVSGSSGRKSNGEAPEEEGIRNFFLFLKATYLEKGPLVVKLLNRQHEICRTTFE